MGRSTARHNTEFSGYKSYRPVIQSALAQGDVKSALATLISLSQAGVIDAELMDDMATCYWTLGDEDSALKLIEVMANDLKTNAAAWGKLGAMAASVGDTSRAETAFRAALKFHPRDSHTLAALNRIKGFGKSSRHTRTLRTIAASKTADISARVTALNALGHIEDRAGNSRAAFFNWQKSKALSAMPFDASAFETQQKQLRTTYTLDTDDQGFSERRIIFIVGMPRSGTTLVESILSQHPSVCACGESDALTRTRAQAEAGTHDARRAAPLRNRYISALLGLREDDPEKLLVDKTPLNILEIWFAKQLFPNAAFIYMSRHPLDVGLSNFSTNFHSAHPYSHSLSGIGTMSRVVHTTAQAFEAQHGPTLRWQSYEALVREPEQQIRAILDHLNLGWHAGCLFPEQRRGAVRTASVLQIRNTINTDAIGRWQRYKDALKPLVAALGGPDRIDTWSQIDNPVAAM